MFASDKLGNEMSSLVLFAALSTLRQLVYPGGSVADGKKVFGERQCAGCHAGGRFGARQLPGQATKYSEVTLIAALWRHGPQMLERMKEKNMEWPRFTADQMSDLIAYLNAGE